MGKLKSLVEVPIVTTERDEVGVEVAKDEKIKMFSLISPNALGKQLGGGIYPYKMLEIQVSSVIEPMLGFEKFESSNKGNLYYFSNRNNSKQLIIHCINEEVAIAIERALSWFFKYAEGCVRRLVSNIILNFAKDYRFLEDGKIQFCLPPRPSDSSNEVRNRLEFLMPSLSPVAVSHSEGTFFVHFLDQKKAKKLKETIVDMGWAAIYNKKAEHQLSIIVTKKREVLPVVEEEISSDSEVAEEILSESVEDPKDLLLETTEVTESSIETENIASIVVEEISPEINEEILSENSEAAKLPSEKIFPDVLAHDIVDSKEEAVYDLETIFMDRGAFSVLPKETQEKVILQLKKSFKEELKKDHLESFVNYLLNFLEKN